MTRWPDHGSYPAEGSAPKQRMVARVQAVRNVRCSWTVSRYMNWFIDPSDHQLNSMVPWINRQLCVEARLSRVGNATADAWASC